MSKSVAGSKTHYTGTWKISNARDVAREEIRRGVTESARGSVINILSEE